MHDKEINYVSQLHFNDGVRFVGMDNNSYLKFKWNNSGSGGIRFYDGDDTHHGYIYGDGAGRFGLLDNDGNWAVRIQTGTDPLELSCDNNTELRVYNSYVQALGSSRAPIFYDSDNTGRYLNPNGTSSLQTIHMNNNNLTNVNHITINDPGVGEGIEWLNGNGWKIYESPDNLTNAAGNLQFVTSSTRLGTITTSGTFELSGGGIGSSSDSVAKVLYPKGATYTEGTNNVTGAIKITLPQSWTNTMMKMHVSIFDYSSNESFDLILAGYNYTGSGGYWVNCSSQAIGSPNVDRSFNIRYGHDGTKCCIFIGETTSTWNYPKVVVTKFIAGHSNNEFHKWDDGWDITRETSLASNIDVTQVAYQQNRYISILYDIDNTSYYVDPASTSQVNNVTMNGELILDSFGGTTKFIAGSGDAANYTNQNVVLSGWNGLGFYNPTSGGTYANQTTAFYDFRNGIFNVKGSHRAPIFYDKDDTNYYIDPSTSGTSAYLRGNILINKANSTGTAIEINSVRDSSWAFEFTTNDVGNDNWSGFWVGSDGYPDMRLRREGSTVNALISSWERSYTTHGFTDSTDMRAPVFYDSNNTGYYVDPASTSVFGRIVTGTTSTSNGGTVFRAEDTAGSATERLAEFKWNQGSTVQYGAKGTRFYNVAYGGGAVEFYRASQYGPDGNAVAFVTGSTTVGSISQTGSATSYNTTSDYRLKENVIDLTGGIERVKQLQPRRFNFIENPDNTVDGFIAHEADLIVPESVTGEKDEVYPNGEPVYQAMDNAKLVPVLTAALKEAISKIEDLETRVQSLENQ